MTLLSWMYVACPVYKMADVCTVYSELLGRQWLYSGAAATEMLGRQEWGDTHYFGGKTILCPYPIVCAGLLWVCQSPPLPKTQLISYEAFKGYLNWRWQFIVRSYGGSCKLVTASIVQLLPPESHCTQLAYSSHKWVVMTCMNDPWLSTQLHWSLKHVSFLNWWHIAPAVHPTCHTSLQALIHIIHIII